MTLPGSGDRPRRDGLIAHRSTTLAGRDVTIRDGIPVTTPARTLVDLPRDLVRGARRQAEFDRLPFGPAHRSDRTRSDLEAAFLALCRRHALPRPEVNVKIERFTVDFLWPAQRLVVETDGYGSHSGWQAFQDDRVRDARLALLGCRVLRFSDWQVANEPGAVADTLRTVLAR